VISVTYKESPKEILLKFFFFQDRLVSIIVALFKPVVVITKCKKVQFYSCDCCLIKYL